MRARNTSHKFSEMHVCANQLSNTYMLEYDKVSKGIDVNKIKTPLECIICHYSYFFKINFRFQPKVFDNCHDLMQNIMGFNDVAIVSTKAINCRIHFWCMSKDEAIYIMKNFDLYKKQ